MYDIKLGQGCGIKATMLTPAGGVCDPVSYTHLTLPTKA